MLWVVTFRGSYYDNDPRMPGSVPVEGSVYVLARGFAEAIAKAEPLLGHLRTQCSKGERDNPLEAHIVTLEALVPGAERSSPSRLAKVRLDHDSDARRYRLAVCLVPVEGA